MADSKTRQRSRSTNTDGIVLNHLQPQALELEEAVIGALMIEQDAFPKVSDIVKKESFYDHRHQVIYEAVANLSLNQRPIDILTVTEQLKSNGTLDEAGGALYVTQLAGKVASSAHIEYHARIIAQKAMARELITFTSEIQTEAFDDTTDISELLGEAENKLFQIAHRNVKKDFASIDVVLQESVNRIRTAAQRAEGMSGLASGFHDLDNITSGWQKSDLIILAARPAMGK
ncbi:MAG: replicative DNA helicase, partial [Bacteroidaceae bacterium]|nr:replicative DNA helicase [Bacteroidaceae bacterium]